MAVKKRGLGKGLDALLGTSSPASKGKARQAEELKHLPVDLIQPGRFQPRTGMDPDKLQELADSIKVQGVIQPIVVRPIGGGRFEIEGDPNARPRRCRYIWAMGDGRRAAA